jgi:hypothetical protein
MLCASYAQELADIVARLPADPRQRLVPADLPDAAVAQAPGGARIRHDGAGLPARPLGRLSHDTEEGQSGLHNGYSWDTSSTRSEFSPSGRFCVGYPA